MTSREASVSRMKSPRVGRPLGNWIVGFGGLIVVGTWIVALVFIREDRRGELARAGDSTASLSNVLEQHISGTFEQMESSLNSLRRNWESGMGVEEMHRFLHLFVAANPDLFNLISIIDADGHVVVTDQAEFSPTYSGDRPFFAVHRQEAGSSMRVGGPTLGRVTGKWYLPVSIRLANEKGEFSGVVLASVNPYYFSMLFRSANLGRDSLIYLAAFDGSVLSGMSGGRELDLGMAIPHVPEETIRRETGSAFTEESMVDGRERIRSQVPVHGRQMFVSVGLGLSEWLAPWRARAFVLLGIESFLSVCIVGVALRLRRTIASRELATRELDRFFSSALDLLCMADVRGNFLRVNREWETILGYRTEDLEGRRFLDFVHPDDLSSTLDALARLDKQDAVLNFCNRYRGKDGAYRHLEWRSVAHGSTVYAAARDVTDRIRGEEKLRLFMEAIDNASDAIGMATPDGRHFYQNKAFDRLFGSVGEHPAETLYVDRAVGNEVFAAIMAGGTWEGEVAMHGADKRLVVAFLRAYAAKDERGRVLVLVGMHTDITERKRAETEQSKLREQLLQAQKMESVGRLAGGVAHDFNNMLAVILGNVEMALDSMPEDQPLHAELTEVRKAAERSADLTRQLLAFARKQAVEPRMLDLNATVNGMLRMIQRLIGENVELIWRPGDDLWPVKMDPSQLDQILTNLCVNARDAIADVGRISIETSNFVLDEMAAAELADAVPGDYVRLVVGDSGSGMDKETLSHLFEPFFTTKALGKGTGLGLATIYGAVRQNNGFVLASSAPGVGTTIGVYLPSHANEPKGAGPVEDSEESLLRGRETILLVEDEESIMNLAVSMLRSLGYAVLPAATPGEALRLADEHFGKIHLLLTDVIMPEMNGRDLARKLVESQSTLKCLFMSGYTSDVIAHHGVLDEDTLFIQKPFSMKQLAAKLRKALGEA